jgi:PTS system mannose-specific IIA component
LPMLIHLIQVRTELTLEEAVQAACDAGQRYIRIGSEILNRGK